MLEDKLENEMNGYDDDDIILPDDVWEEIFLQCDVETINKIATVSKDWNQIISSSIFWKRKLLKQQVSLPQDVIQSKRLNWKVLRSFCRTLSKHKVLPYNVNLIQNASGELETDPDKLLLGNRNEVDFDEYWFQHWFIWSSGGQGWRLFKEDDLTYFAASYISCTKSQTVDLVKRGVDPVILDEYQPEITIKDHWSHCRNHAGVYELKVKLMNAEMREVTGFSRRVLISADDPEEWRSVGHVFSEYGGGVRFVELYHGGMSDDMEEGWQGPRMRQSTVTIQWPR